MPPPNAADMYDEEPPDAGAMEPPQAPLEEEEPQPAMDAPPPLPPPPVLPDTQGGGVDPLGTLALAGDWLFTVQHGKSTMNPHVPREITGR